MANVPTTDLGRFIEWVSREKFSTQDALAVAMGVSPQTISRYRNEDPLKSIIPGVMRDLAKVTGTPLVEVLRKALSSAGLPDVYEPSTDIAELVAEDSELSTQHKQMIIALIREARESSRRATVHPLRQPVARKKAARNASRQSKGSEEARQQDSDANAPQIDRGGDDGA